MHRFAPVALATLLAATAPALLCAQAPFTPPQSTTKFTDPANLAGERVTLKLYPGGHMMYLRSASRHQLHDDAAAFYAAK